VPGIRVYFDERHIEFFRPGDPEDLARKAIALLKDPQRQAQLASQAWEVYEAIRWGRTKITYKKLIGDLLNSECIEANV
jgi:glycosyltransferase involved in cell wall biosynthesis